MNEHPLYKEIKDLERIIETLKLEKQDDKTKAKIKEKETELARTERLYFRLNNLNT